MSPFHLLVVVKVLFQIIKSVCGRDKCVPGNLRIIYNICAYRMSKYNKDLFSIPTKIVSASHFTNPCRIVLKHCHSFAIRICLSNSAVNLDKSQIASVMLPSILPFYSLRYAINPYIAPLKSFQKTSIKLICLVESFATHHCCFSFFPLRNKKLKLTNGTV